jgi:hypothetical protein
MCKQSEKYACKSDHMPYNASTPCKQGENRMSIEKARGGYARAEKLTPEERRSIAKKAAEARWMEDVPVAAYGAADRPLRIKGLSDEADIEIPCYVLEDGRRVLVQSGMLKGMDMKQGTAGRGAGDRLVRFIATKSVSPYVKPELGQVITNPIKFRVPSGTIAYGYEATVLADMCDAVLEARKAGALNYQQEHIAQRCEILVRGFARVGIIALVDEATGFQEERARDALAKILEAFIDKELQPWIQTFPSDFYQGLFRLRGLDYPKDSVRRPQYFGILTNDIVYKRLAPGVLEELRRVTPKAESGRRKHKYFQRLTSNVGYPKLREHLGSVVTIMKLSADWADFTSKIDRLHPRYGETMMLPFPDDNDQDDGKGL